MHPPSVTITIAQGPYYFSTTNSKHLLSESTSTAKAALRDPKVLLIFLYSFL